MTRKMWIMLKKRKLISMCFSAQDILAKSEVMSALKKFRKMMACKAIIRTVAALARVIKQWYAENDGKCEQRRFTASHCADDIFIFRLRGI